MAVSYTHLDKYKKSLEPKKEQLERSNNPYKYRKCSELNRCLVCDEHLYKEKYSLKRCKYCGMFYVCLLYTSKWASTTASMVSAPASKPMNADAVSTPAGSGDPFAPANGGEMCIRDRALTVLVSETNHLSENIIYSDLALSLVL